MKKNFRDHHLLLALDSYDAAGAPLDVHLGHYFRANKSLGSKDRKFIAEKIYTLVRWLSLVDHHCNGSHTWEARYEALKNISLDKALTNLSIPPHIRASFPKNLFEKLSAQYGEEKALELAHISNQEAPTTVRVNALKIGRHTLLKRLQDIYEVSPTTTSPWGMTFAQRHNFAAFPEFSEGLFEVQDEASQLIASLIDAKPGDRVLDYCAGSGGKTLAFAPKLQGQGQIYLHDVRPKALQNARRRLKRAGIENYQFLPEDSSKLLRKMDWILVDVPCSGTGTLRRNPDIKWKFSKEMLERLIFLQREIVNEVIPYLAPNGRIVYATCSMLGEENEAQIDYFERHHGLLPARKPFRSLPSKGGMDGFFGAVMAQNTSTSV